MIFGKTCFFYDFGLKLRNLSYKSDEKSLVLHKKQNTMVNNNFKQALHLGMKLAVVLVGACMFAHVGMDFTFSFIFLWKGLSNMKKKGR